MTGPLTTENDALARRFLVCSATSRDGEIACKVLSSAGIECQICEDARALQTELDRGAGGILTVEDALVDSVLDVLRDHVERAPDWSDLPILVLAGKGADSLPVQRVMNLLRNVVLLDRPVRTASLITNARSALLARDRQYQVKEAQEKLHDSEQRFKSMFDNHPDGAFVRDLDGRIISANAAHEELLGYNKDELRYLPFATYVAPEKQKQEQRSFGEAARGVPQKFSTRKIRKDGNPVDVDIVYFPVVVNREIVGVHGVARDITEANSQKRRIRYLATHDALTGLPNRTMLDDRLNHALEQAKRAKGQVGVLFLDLNRFKPINDSMGHEQGDELLKIIASRLKQAVRDADTVARQGGDEFVIVLEDLASIEDMVTVAQNLIEAVAQPVELHGHEVSVSTSIGGSVYPKDAEDAGTLLKYADMAMYKAKEQGSGMFLFYDKQMNQHVLERLLMENALRLALQNDELEVHYQPRINIRTKKVIGVEALVRWNHPQKGVVLPADFIPLAEEIGLINQIGEWVLRTACTQARTWQKLGFPPVRMAVNISAYQLSSPFFADKTQEILADANLSPGSLELEVTESSLMKNVEMSCELLGRLRAQGVLISMDDFGTGYSSLAQIKRLPVDTLKIDQSFIRNIIDDPNDAAIVSATIALAQHMGLNIVAEGVNSESQVDFLLDRNCEEMQGYLFGRPQSSVLTTALLKSEPLVSVAGL